MVPFNYILNILYRQGQPSELHLPPPQFLTQPGHLSLHPPRVAHIVNVCPRTVTQKAAWKTLGLSSKIFFNLNKDPFKNISSLKDMTIVLQFLIALALLLKLGMSIITL